jgi:hypothetical protein
VEQFVRSYLIAGVIASSLIFSPQVAANSEGKSSARQTSWCSHGDPSDAFSCFGVISFAIYVFFIAALWD